jgi:hypothetical protein
MLEQTPPGLVAFRRDEAEQLKWSKAIENLGGAGRELALSVR